MPLIYITGISGAGKSTICDHLKKAGAEAHDADSEGFNGYYNKDSGLLENPTNNVDAHGEEWNSTHSWRMSREKVEALAKDAKVKTIYLCGTAKNNKELIDIFSKVIILWIDEDTLHHRIMTRSTSEYGKTPNEWQNILKGFKAFKDNQIKSDAIIIDATQPIETVVEEILRVTSNR
jgi:dephospho-CoA kinase